MSQTNSDGNEPKKRGNRIPFDPKNATDSTPLRIEWLAKYLHTGRKEIQRAIAKGYRMELPRIGMTTARHFLSWASKEGYTLEAAAKRPTETARPKRRK